MGDMGDLFNAHREYDRERREHNLARAEEERTEEWRVHSPYHWARLLQGKRLDYWPSRNKWRWKDRTYTGDITGFIRNRTNEESSDD